ncbi:MAG: leucine--tRNA ligase [Thermoplasmatota archaeon]
MQQKKYDYIAVEKSWQHKWFNEQINIAVEKNKKKFFIHFAYPGVSGYLHVGHMRGFTYCDVIARYKKMRGYDVLFPAGFHASGIPSVGFAKKVERADKETIDILKKNGCSTELIKKLIDPYEVVKYFSTVYVEDYWKRFGFFIDYSRLMNTISDGYKKFISWQFQKLNDKQLLIQKPHFAPFCPHCGPVAVDKSETDVLCGGSSEILEFTIIKFKLSDGTILPAATLRPETIFGVTNMWVNPSVEYHKIKVNDEVWICSQECINKLSYQYDSIVYLQETISGQQLIGKSCTIPKIGREIPILSGTFADPKIATGIVMSVPAHAPYDWIALVESKQNIDPICIIDVKDFSGNFAKQVCDSLQIISQNQTEKLDEATELVYKKEFHTGVLNKHCGIYEGVKISDIKDTVKNDLIAENQAAVMREFSEDVICRCKEHVVIKNIPDQWFIKYSDEQLTNESKQYAQTMNIYPSEYKEDLPKILDWFDDRAVIRKGSWLGTEFPFKKDWIIEPISDSTLYPAYYIISKFVNEQKLSVDEMTGEFFDYVFLGIGSPRNKMWEEVKSSFDYWYPVDINLGGKEHKTVHFPVYIMNHVAIMPKEKCPQGLFVHWWVTQKGKEKISKSKGGAEPILEAARLYGVDAMRLYYTHVGSPFVDIEWDADIVNKYKNRISSLYNFIIELSKKDESEINHIDNWLISRLYRHIKTISDAFEHFDLRIAANEVFFEMQRTIQWYIKRGGGNKKVLHHFLSAWIPLISPIAPHLAEELWVASGHSGFVSKASFPSFNENKLDAEVEVGEYLLLAIIEDIGEILKVTKIKPQKICIYVSPNWKKDVFTQAINIAQSGNLQPGVLIKKALSDPRLKSQAKEVSSYIGRLPSEINKLNESDRERYLVDIDEKKYLQLSKKYLSDLFSSDIEIYASDEENIYDPLHKSRFAVPLRPAIYIE